MVSDFVENGMMEETERPFSAMMERNSVSWDVMISGYAKRGDLDSFMMQFMIDLFKRLLGLY